jgi:hypothetical protein
MNAISSTDAEALLFKRFTPEFLAEKLEELGYTVTPPPDPDEPYREAYALFESTSDGWDAGYVAGTIAGLRAAVWKMPEMKEAVELLRRAANRAFELPINLEADISHFLDKVKGESK